MAPLFEPVPKDRLAHLFGTRRVHRAPRPVKVDAGRLERQVAKPEQAAHVALEVADQPFVPDHNFGAWVPALDGCVATGSTLEEVTTNIREAIEFHIEGMLLAGESVPAGKYALAALTALTANEVQLYFVNAAAALTIGWALGMIP